MRFPPELEREVFRLIRIAPADHITFPAEEYKHGRVVIYRDNLAKTLHRYLWERAFGMLPRAVYLQRTCSEPRCVNPHHFEQTERTRDLPERCRNDHRYTKGNTRIDGRGVRHCLRCERDRRARKAKGRTRRPGYCRRNHRITPENDYPWTDRQGRLHHRCARCKREYEIQRRANA